MPSALIGYTGFVGGSLLRQCAFQALYNSVNIDEIRGRHFDLVVCAGAPGKKWLANKEPAQDKAALESLQGALASCRAERVVLISTVDVYPAPHGVDESTPISRGALQPYGRHRLELEDFVAARFPKTHVVRLPALFGRGLKKNFLFDLLNDNCLDMTDKRSQFQFYDMERLWADCRRVIDADLPLTNFATKPVDCAQVAEQCFGQTFEGTTAQGPVTYDMQTQHAESLGARGRYIMDSDEVLSGISQFVGLERKRTQCA